MTIERVARQGNSTARTREHRNGWCRLEGRAATAPGPREGPPTEDAVDWPKIGAERDGRPDSPPLSERLPRRSISHVEALDVEPQLRPRSRRVQREHGGAVRPR